MQNEMKSRLISYGLKYYNYLGDVNLKNNVNKMINYLVSNLKYENKFKMETKPASRAQAWVTFAIGSNASFASSDCSPLIGTKWY